MFASSSVAAGSRPPSIPPSDKGLELRVTHALHVDCGGGFELSRHQRCDHAHELDGMRPRRGHQRWLAESLPCITEIAEEVLTQAFVREPCGRPLGLPD